MPLFASVPSFIALLLPRLSIRLSTFHPFLASRIREGKTVVRSLPVVCSEFKGVGSILVSRSVLCISPAVPCPTYLYEAPPHPPVLPHPPPGPP
eukprot:753929-Hanusia_phi.AAC.1